MREDILDPRKQAAKADDIWQSSSARSVNVVSAVSPPLPDQDEFVQALPQCPQPCPAPHVAPCPAPWLPILQLCPLVPPPTSAGIIASMVIKLNIAKFRVPGFTETS